MDRASHDKEKRDRMESPGTIALWESTNLNACVKAFSVGKRERRRRPEPERAIYPQSCDISNVAIRSRYRKRRVRCSIATMIVKACLRGRTVQCIREATCVKIFTSSSCGHCQAILLSSSFIDSDAGERDRPIPLAPHIVALYIRRGAMRFPLGDNTASDCRERLTLMRHRRLVCDRKIARA